MIKNNELIEAENEKEKEENSNNESTEEDFLEINKDLSKALIEMKKEKDSEKEISEEDKMELNNYNSFFQNGFNTISFDNYNSQKPFNIYNNKTENPNEINILNALNLNHQMTNVNKIAIKNENINEEHFNNINYGMNTNDLNNINGINCINNIFKDNFYNESFDLNKINTDKVNQNINDNNILSNLNNSNLKNITYENKDFSNVYNLHNSNLHYNNINDYSNKNVNSFSVGKNINEGNFDSPKFFINIENILHGKDKRTTIIMCNIPNSYSISKLLRELNKKFYHKYDIVYLPKEISNCSNLGYGFINFVDHMHLIYFWDMFEGKKWNCINSNKKCKLTYSKYQGKDKLIEFIHKKIGIDTPFDCKDNLKNSFFLNDETKYTKPPIEIPNKFFMAFKSVFP